MVLPATGSGYDRASLTHSCPRAAAGTSPWPRVGDPCCRKWKIAEGVGQGNTWADLHWELQSGIQSGGLMGARTRHPTDATFP